MLFYSLLYWTSLVGAGPIDQREREDYATLAPVCLPSARMDDRSRSCLLDKGDDAKVRAIARDGTGKSRELAARIVEKLDANRVSFKELADHEQRLAICVLKGLLAEKAEDAVPPGFRGAKAAVDAHAERRRIVERQRDIEQIVQVELPALAVEFAGPPTSKPLLRVHPFYEQKEVAADGRRGGSFSPGVQHFHVDLRNDEVDRDLHCVTVQLTMRDAKNRTETFTGYWDRLGGRVVVPLCTWKTGVSRTSHFAGCAIPASSKAHFVYFTTTVYCNEGTWTSEEKTFNHLRMNADLVTYERTRKALIAERIAKEKAKAKAVLELKKRGSTASVVKANDESTLVFASFVDDEEPKAKKKKGDEADEEDPKPKKKKKADDEEEEEPKPKKKKAAEAEEDDEEEKTEPFLADFSVGTGETPDGWSVVGDNRPCYIDRTAGAAFLTGPGASQSPLLTIRKDFFVEFTVLSTERSNHGDGKLEATFEGRDGVTPLGFSIVKNTKGFEFKLSGADKESRSVGLGGMKPHKVRMERKGTAFRVFVNGKVVHTYAGDEAPEYDLMKVALANYGLHVFKIQVGPLKKEAPKPKPRPTPKDDGS